MKKKVSDLSEKEVMVALDALYTSASSLEGRDAMKGFLKDLLTESERVMLGRRILVARMLLSGDTQRDIVERLGVGFGTVANVQKWLDDSMPGYERALEGLEKEYADRTDRLSPEDSLRRLKKKYPLHFLLFPGKKK